MDPGFETLEGEPDRLAPRSADGWYSVDETGREGEIESQPPGSGQTAPPAEPSVSKAIWDRINMQLEAFLALIALMAVLAAILIWVRIQRRRAEEAITEAPTTAPVLTAGVRASMGEKTAEQADGERDKEAVPKAEDETMAEPPPTEPADDTSEESAVPSAPASVADEAPASITSPAPPPPVTPPPPAPAPSPSPPAITPSVTPSAKPSTKPNTTTRAAVPLSVELSLDIKTASRSLMKLTVEFALEVTNRADQALRDINIAGELASVQQGAAGPAPVDKTLPLATIDRIAPGQSRRISGTLELPIGQVTSIKQNGKPVVIPLIHFRLGTPDMPAIKRTFVVGTPSTTSTTRVHPLLFAGPPGGLPPLRAQLIKQP